MSTADEWARQQIEALKLRVAALERQLAGGAPDDLPPGDPAGEAGMDIGVNEEVLALLRDGKEAHAVALYRRQAACGLSEAKAEIDRLKAQLSA